MAVFTGFIVNIRVENSVDIDQLFSKTGYVLIYTSQHYWPVSKKLLMPVFTCLLLGIQAQHGYWFKSVSSQLLMSRWVHGSKTVVLGLI